MGLLRFLLAIAVVIAHSDSIFGVALLGGELAVKSFYIISGFYMALVVTEKYSGKRNSYKLFITNRFLRLYPIYWTVLILTIFYSVAIFIYNNGANLGPMSAYLTYYSSLGADTICFLVVTNIFIFLQDAVLFLGVNISSGHLFFTTDFHFTNPKLFSFLIIPQAWTVGLELMFYLIAPFLVKRKLSTIGLLIVLSILLRIGLSYFGLNNDPWSYRFFPTELVFFLLGIMSYHIYTRVRRYDESKLAMKLPLLFMLAFIFCYSFLPGLGKIYLFLGSVFLTMPFIFHVSKNWTLDSYIGELSYPIYISHMLVVNFLNAYKVQLPFGVSVSIVTIFLSVILNKLVAKRIEEYRQRRVLQFKVG